MNIIEATQILLKKKKHKKLYKLYLDLIYNRIIEIGALFNIRPPKSNEKIYDYMNLIDNFLDLNFKITLFHDLSEDLKKYCKLYNKFKDMEKDVIIDQYDVKEVVEFYYKIKEIKIPNIHEEIYGYKNAKLGLTQPIEAYKYVFGKGDKTRKSLDFNTNYSEMIISRIENESDEIRNRYDKGKMNFEKCFKKLSVLNSVKKSVETSKKSSKKMEVKGKLSESLEYKFFSENLYGYFILALAIISGVFTGLIVIESYFFPVLISNLTSYVLILAPIAIILCYYFIKNYVR